WRGHSRLPRRHSWRRLLFRRSTSAAIDLDAGKNAYTTGAQMAANVDYGIDAPRTVKSLWSRAGWTFVFGFFLYWINRREYPGPGLTLFAVLGVFAGGCAAAAWIMTWSSRVAKLEMRDRLLDQLELKGDEKVLDVGCGRGLLAIGAAKRLKSGRVTGID